MAFVLLVVALSSFIFVTAGSANEPPTTPSNPVPGDGVTGISLSFIPRWQSSDPEGMPLTFDIYLGTVEPLPKVFSGNSFFRVGDLLPTTPYKWRIVARDDVGLETTGPTWTFTTKANSPPDPPHAVSPLPGTAGHAINTLLKWQAFDPDLHDLTCDVYFGTSSPPPLVATDVACDSQINEYDPGPQTIGTLYFWKIVVRDPFGAETSGPVWSYTTRNLNEPPNPPSYVSPGNGETVVPIDAMLSWSASDPDGQTLTFDVYFGTAADPPLIASDVTSSTYDPGLLATSTVYRWRIVARDSGGLVTSSALWLFTTSNLDNLQPSVPANPSPLPLSHTGPNVLLQWTCTDPDGDPLTYTLYRPQEEIGQTPFATTTVPQQSLAGLTPGTTFSWKVVATDGVFNREGPWWLFYVDEDGNPVLFSRFDAKQSRDGVEIRWELSADEAMEEVVLYRRARLAGEPVAIHHGSVKLADEYRDTDVEPGKTYHYELLVRTSAGDEFRSPVATVSMAALELTLHQNHPNPFNPQTAIRYDIPSPTRVRLTIFDASGRRIRALVDEDQAPGSREVVWTGRDDAGTAVSSGVYFYALDAGKARLTRKLVLLR